MNVSAREATPAPSAAHGRACIIAAALLWSTSGAFAKVLTRDTPLNLHVPELRPESIAFYRALFAGLALLPFVRWVDMTWRPLMVPMTLSFAVMNITFVSAQTLGTAANAIVLQYTAPMWMYLAGIWWLGEPSDRRTLTAILISLVGIAVIVVGGWQGGELNTIGLGLVSGSCYALVVVCLRSLRQVSSLWMTSLNHLVSAAVVLPFILTLPAPSAGQFAVLFVYGAIQMSVPYSLMARGLRSVAPAEAGTITLLEPVLNPCWAYLVSGEEPSRYTMIGGVFIIGALAWRYWPYATQNEKRQTPKEA